MKENKKILAKDIFQYLIKEVFGTYSFPENKWNYNRDIPDVGRTYFQDRKDKMYPINRDGIEKMKLLYESALSGKMKISDRTVSAKLNSLLQSVFDLDYSFLVYYDDDTEVLRNAKKGSWLLILDHILDKLVDRSDISLKEFDDTKNEYSTIFQRIERVAENTYTEILQSEIIRKEEQKEILSEINEGEGGDLKKLLRSNSKDLQEAVNMYYDVVSNKSMFEIPRGMILFFLNCSITNVKEFTATFPQYSKLEIRRMLKYRCSVEDRDLPKEYGSTIITYAEWKMKKILNQIFVINENDYICSGYDIVGIRDGLNNGISYVCEGSCEDFYSCREIFKDIALFLVVPDTIERLILEAECRSYFQADAKLRFETVKQNIDLIMAHEGFVIRWQAEKDDRLTAYYAGLIDSIITVNPLTQQLNRKFLEEYKNFLDQLILE